MHIQDFFQNFLKLFLVGLHDDYTINLIAHDISPTTGAAGLPLSPAPSPRMTANSRYQERKRGRNGGCHGCLRQGDWTRRGRDGAGKRLQFFSSPLLNFCWVLGCLQFLNLDSLPLSYAHTLSLSSSKERKESF